MRYMALIYQVEQDSYDMDDQAVQQEIEEYFAFDDEARAAGVLVAGEALQPTSTATSIRVREGETLTVDGPFAETKEALGGYYVLECADLDDAVKWAARLPGARKGTVEVRPIIDFERP
jgi:hypothetical protein